MDIDRKQIMETFVRIVNHISDKEYQRRAWIKGEEADFDETVCHFFDDGDPIIGSYTDYGIRDDQYHLLKNFRDKFRAFSDENYWPPEFIDTPEWGKITEMAKDVLIDFNYKK